LPAVSGKSRDHNWNLRTGRRKRFDTAPTGQCPGRVIALAVVPQLVGSGRRMDADPAHDTSACRKTCIAWQQYAGMDTYRHCPVHRTGREVRTSHVIAPYAVLRRPTGEVAIRDADTQPRPAWLNHRSRVGNSRISMHTTRSMCQCHYRARGAVDAVFVPDSRQGRRRSA
jgi:hypothetical protein